MSNELFKKELQSSVASVLDETKVESIINATTKYFGINNTANGKEFYEKVILDAAKDYPTDDMRFYQALTELKSRLGRIYDDTLALKKLEIELEILELDFSEMKQETRREQLNRQLKEQEVTQKKVRIAFAKDSLNSLSNDIDDFKSICDKYAASGNIKPYNLARLEEMELKKKARYINHLVHGVPLSPSETSFYYQSNGLLKPPDGVVEELQKLGFMHLATQEKQKLTGLEQTQQDQKKLVSKNE